MFPKWGDLSIMKAQASMEVFLYFGLLMVLLGGVLLWLLDYMNLQITLSQALTLYTFQVKLASNLEEIAKLGDGSYLKIYLPKTLLGTNYSIYISYDGASKQSLANLYLGSSNNSIYGFIIKSTVKFGNTGSVILEGGHEYIFENKGTYIEVKKV